MNNPYAILNVTSDSTSDEIKAAYRKAVLRYHPDRGGNPEKFRQIQDAYDILSNPTKRREYDMHRRSAGDTGSNHIIVRQDTGRYPIDVFDDLVDVLRRRFGMISLEKFEADIILNSDEARFGTKVDTAIPFERICEGCFGFGGTIISDCGDCGGSGMKKLFRNVILTIEPGAQNNDRLLYRDEFTEVVGRIVVQ